MTKLYMAREGTVLESSVAKTSKRINLNEQILIFAKKLFDETMNIPLGVSIGAVFGLLRKLQIKFG